MLRLFVAIELPEAARTRLALVQGGMPGARWVTPESLHLTILFLGELDDGIAQDLDDRLAAIEAPGFELAIEGLGQFGAGRRWSALWAGVKDPAPLKHLHAKVSRVAIDCGIKADLRDFRPHVTLARLDQTSKPERIARWLAERGGFAIPSFPVGEFILYRSHLGQGGPVYEPLVRYPLAGPGG